MDRRDPLGQKGLTVLPDWSANRVSLDLVDAVGLQEIVGDWVHLAHLATKDARDKRDQREILPTVEAKDLPDQKDQQAREDFKEFQASLVIQPVMDLKDLLESVEPVETTESLGPMVLVGLRDHLEALAQTPNIVLVHVVEPQMWPWPRLRPCRLIRNLLLFLLWLQFRWKITKWKITKCMRL